MTNRNIAIYELVENTDTTIEGKFIKKLIKEPYTIDVDFKAYTIDIVVAVDNDFDNGSFTIDTLNDNVVIKRSGNVVKIVVDPNYGDYSVDTIVHFQHNVVEELHIPLLIRQQPQLFNMLLEPVLNCSGDECCNYDIRYIAKDNRPIVKRSYKIRDNVFLQNGEEKVIDNDEDFAELTPSIEEVSPLIYANNDMTSEIYVDEYWLLSTEERENYAPLYYIFDNEEYNKIYECDWTVEDDEDSCNNIPSECKPYKYKSSDNEVISVYEWLNLPEEAPDEGGIGQDHYPICVYVKTYNASDVQTVAPRYMYEPSIYRNEISNDEYSALNDVCKNACIPVVYVHINKDDVEISADEYDGLSMKDQHFYTPKWYMVRDNVDKETCVTVVSAEEYETYVTEGKYDYSYCDEDCDYYREITAEEYDAYPEKGQNEYYIYQYQCIKSFGEYKIGDVIDFVEYDSLGLSENDAHFRIYRYGSGEFTYVYVNEGDVITNDEYEYAIPDDEKDFYTEIRIDGVSFWECKNNVTVDYIAYQTQINRNRFIIEETITPSKFNSLPIYGKEFYSPYEFTYEETVGINEYYSINLTRSDYVLDTIELGDDMIDIDTYDSLDWIDQQRYEMCILLNSIVNSNNICISPVKVKCVGGSYDFIINGMSKYWHTTRQNYETDSDDIIIGDYNIDNDEEYIADEPLFKLEKIRSKTLDSDGFVVNMLKMTSYGWLDSTFIEDMLDNGIFYRIRLSHRDVVGLERTIRIMLGYFSEETDKLQPIDYSLNKLEPRKPSGDGEDDGDTDDNPGEGGDDDGDTDDNPDEEVIEPGITVNGLSDGSLTFSRQGGIKTVTVDTVPTDSAISTQYTSNLISKCEVDGHSIKITVPKNQFTNTRACKLTVINSEYPEYSQTFIVVQNGT